MTLYEPDDDLLDYGPLKAVPLSTRKIRIKITSVGPAKPSFPNPFVDDDLDDIEAGQSKSIWPYVMGRYD